MDLRSVIYQQTSGRKLSRCKPQIRLHSFLAHSLWKNRRVDNLTFIQHNSWRRNGQWISLILYSLYNYTYPITSSPSSLRGTSVQHEKRIAWNRLRSATWEILWKCHAYIMEKEKITWQQLRQMGWGRCRPSIPGIFLPHFQCKIHLVN